MYNITNEDILKLDEFMKSEDIEKSSIQSGRDENGMLDCRNKILEMYRGEKYE